MTQLDIKITKVLSVFETGKPDVDREGVYTLPDGKNGRKQVTSTFGFTEEFGDEKGSLLSLLEVYASVDGMYSQSFAPYLPLIGTGVLAENEKFKILLKTAAKDATFRDTQDFVFKTMYLNRGYRAAEGFGLKLELSKLVAIDGILHGSFYNICKPIEHLCPRLGGDEKWFVKEYLNRRVTFLKSKKKTEKTIYRPLDFLRAIELDNWDLFKPFSANGTIIV